MAFLGAGFKFARGLKRTWLLPERIAKAEEKLRVPLLDKYQGAKRFELAQSLLDAKLYAGLDKAGHSAKRQRVEFERYISSLYKEYQMAKSDLSKISATRAEVVALGIAMKQMAFSYDDELTNFTNEKQEALEKVQQGFLTQTKEYCQRLAQLEDEYERELAEHKATVLKRFDVKIKEFDASLSEHLDEFTRQARQTLESEARDLQTVLKTDSEEFHQKIGADIQKLQEHASAQEEIINRQRRWLLAIGLGALSSLTLILLHYFAVI